MTRSIFAAILVALGAFSFSLTLYADETNGGTGIQGSFQPTLLKEVLKPNTILKVDDFNHPSTYNLLGGKTQGDEEEPGGLIPSYTPSGRFTMGRSGHSLKMDYNVTVPMSVAFYSSRFGPRDSTAEDPGASFPVTLEGFNYLSFWIKTDKQYPRFSIEFHQDNNGDHLFTLGQDINSKIAVSRYILMPQADISGKAAEIILDVRDEAFLVEAALQDKSEATKSIAEAAPKEPEEKPSQEAEPLSLFGGGGIVTEVVGQEKAVGAEPKTKGLEDPVVTQPEKKAVMESAKKKYPRSGSRRRRSRSRVSFVQEDELKIAETRRDTRRTSRPRRKVAVEAGSTSQVQSAVSLVVGSGNKRTQTVRSTAQIQAIQKKQVGWRKVVIPLRDFRTVKDWSSILELVFVFENRLGSDQGIIYADDLLFGSNAVSMIPVEKVKTRLKSFNFAPLKSGVSPATIRGIQMVNQQSENQIIHGKDTSYSENGYVAEVLAKAQLVSKDRIKALFAMDQKQEVAESIDLPPVVLLTIEVGSADPLMESVRVEISRDSGKTWNIIRSLYGNQVGGEYVFPWRVPQFSDDKPTWLRVMTADIWGRSILLGGPIILNKGAASEQ